MAGGKLGELIRHSRPLAALSVMGHGRGALVSRFPPWEGGCLGREVVIQADLWQRGGCEGCMYGWFLPLGESGRRCVHVYTSMGVCEHVCMLEHVCAYTELTPEPSYPETQK